MKILVIFTGGTIGSRLHDGWISPDGQAKRALIEHYEELYGKAITFVTEEPYTILSENLDAVHLNRLIKTVCAAAKEDYDGILVTHGTDTLPYTAAALSFALGDDSIPVLLISANYPLEVPRSNGPAHFAAAIEFIRQQKGTGVFVVYRNEHAPIRFHKALSLVCHKEADDAVYSLHNRYYAELEKNGDIRINEDDNRSEKVGEFVLCDSPEILVVDAYPGNCYADLPKPYNAIILRPYHSGTLPTACAAFEKFCLNARENSVPVFAVNVPPGETYTSSKAFDRLGILPVYSSAFVSVYMRLWIAVSRGEDLQNLFG